MNQVERGFSGKSLAIQRLEEQLLRQGKFFYPLLLEGERGSGRKRAADYLYRLGPWSDGPLQRWDASDPHATLPEKAAAGVILLEELGCATQQNQERLWHWLRRAPITTQVRIVSTCEGSLGALVAARKFRSDLYLSLRVATLSVPPLRERKEDIPFLIRQFLEEGAFGSGEPLKMFTAEAMDWIYEFPWPGNVAQLRHEVLRAVAATPGRTIPRDALCPDYVEDPDLSVDLCVREALPLSRRIEEFERREILGTLEEVGGKRDRAAALLGIDRRTLQRKMKKWQGGGEGTSPRTIS